MGLLFEIVITAAPILFVAVLIMWRLAARGSRFSQAQRAFAALAILAAVIPGVWLLTSGNLRSELREDAGIIVIVLSIPIVVALPSVFTHGWLRTLCAAAGALTLAAFCLVSGFSIGLAYVPAAALLIVAGIIGLIPRRAVQ